MPAAAPVLSPLLGRYVDVLAIRTRDAFRVISARRIADNRACVVVLPGEKSDRRAVRDAFVEVRRAHERFAHARVPPVSACDEIEGTPFLEFEFDGVADGFEVVKLMADADPKIPYGAADAFIASLREATEAAHHATDSDGGTQICLGRISLGNVLFNADGEWRLVGFGRNFPVEREDGSVDPTVAYCQAPELAGGGLASPSGDYVALLLFMRSVMPYADMSGVIGRVLRGEAQPSDSELIQSLIWVETRMIGELTQRRASIAEAIAVAERIRAFNGTALDEPGFAKYVKALLARVEETPMPMQEVRPTALAQLTVARDVEWVAAPSGTRHRLGRAHRRILMALIERHREAPTEALTVWDLLRAGWPGETPQLEAGANRVYVAIAGIRQLGLRDLIERFDDGYRLATRTKVVYGD